MKNLIYYPTFEPQELNWIKYALIYIDNFSPIIPDSGRSNLTDLYWKLEDCKLVGSIKPEWNQGDIASTKVLKEIEFIQLHPEQYRDKLNNVNVVRAFKDKGQQKYKLYDEKFNTTFKDYCLEEKFAQECDGGMLISKELGYLYMTFLVDEIAFIKKASPITDNPKLDLLSTYIRTKSIETEERIQAVNTIVDQYLPERIENIDINRLIKFRMDSGIEELRHKFNAALDAFYEAFENNSDISTFLKTLETINKDFIKEIGLFFGGLISISLGGLVVINNPISTSLESVQMIADGTIFTVGGIISIAKSWELNSNRRKARKFLIKLDSI